MTSDLTCPKCHGAMRQYERNSVTVDQCTDCRGIFLDRGELERLIDGENAWHREAPAAPPPPYPSQPSYPQPGYGGYPHKRRKKSFLEELFD